MTSTPRGRTPHPPPTSATVPRLWPAVVTALLMGLGVLLVASVHPRAATPPTKRPAAPRAMIRDEVPPVVRPLLLTTHTRDARGAVVPAGLASAVDDDGTAVAVDCIPEPGTPVDVGNTSIACTATDRAGNVGYATWDLTVVVGRATGPAKTASPASRPALAGPSATGNAALAPAGAPASAAPAPTTAASRSAGGLRITGSLAAATGLAVLSVLVLLAAAAGLGSMAPPVSPAKA